ncbi:MAG TPA: hypothetical protein VLG45_09690 [Thermodesulfobacteriota bacterium]|nr:hypothetical protein [Thermodesulfobacteriota bacterium]
MEENGETLDLYIRKMEDQELKGLLLKLKNELRKQDASWDGVRTILGALHRKNSRVFSEVAPLIIK